MRLCGGDARVVRGWVDWLWRNMSQDYPGFAAGSVVFRNPVDFEEWSDGGGGWQPEGVKGIISRGEPIHQVDGGEGQDSAHAGPIGGLHLRSEGEGQGWRKWQVVLGGTPQGYVGTTPGEGVGVQVPSPGGQDRHESGHVPIRVAKNQCFVGKVEKPIGDGPFRPFGARPGEGEDAGVLWLGQIGPYGVQSRHVDSGEGHLLGELMDMEGPTS